VPDAKLRCVRLRFNKTPIVKFGGFFPMSKEDSEAVLEFDGQTPAAVEHLDHFNVLVFTPWFDDADTQKVEQSRLTGWCREAQRRILDIKPNAFFDPSFV
jgi:hypothetical protein